MRVEGALYGAVRTTCALFASPNRGTHLPWSVDRGSDNGAWLGGRVMLGFGVSAQALRGSVASVGFRIWFMFFFSFFFPVDRWSGIYRAASVRSRHEGSSQILSGVSVSSYCFTLD